MLLTSWIRQVKSRLNWDRWYRKNHQRRTRQDAPKPAVELLEDRTLLASPQLVTVLPNAGEFLLDQDVRTEAPRELTLRFSPGQTIDSGTFDGIVITRAGADNDFEESSVYSDFSTNGAVVVQFDAVRLGAGGDGIQLTFDADDLGSDPPTIDADVTARTIAVTLNNNVGTPTTAQTLIDAINNDTDAQKLVSASIRSGSADSPIAATTVSSLATSGANAAFGTADFNTGGSLEVRFEAVNAGTSEEITLAFKNDSTAATVPQFGVSSTTSGSTIFRTITVTLNPTKATTADELADAINSNGTVNSLIRASVPVGDATTEIQSSEAINPITLSGGDDVILSPGYVGIDPTQTNQVVYRFSESLPDDLYRIEVYGSAAGGVTVLKNSDNEVFNDGEDDRLTFELDLGAQVTSVVPQPVVRDKVITVAAPGTLRDGDRLVVEDGFTTRIFEFDSDSSVYGDNVAVEFDTNIAATTAENLRTAIQDEVDAGRLDLAVSRTSSAVTLRGNAFQTETRLFTFYSGGGAPLTLTDGGITPRTDVVLVYFSPDQFDATVMENTRFYRLIDTGDDSVRVPSSVVFSASNYAAKLPFLAFTEVTTLDGDITDTATSLTLAAGGGSSLPTSNFVVRIGNEDIFVTSRTLDTLDGLIRGFNGTEKVGHLNGAKVFEGASALSNGTYQLQIGTSDESNGRMSTATKLETIFDTTSFTTTGLIGDNGGANDIDLYRVELSETGTITATADPLTSSLDVAVRVFDSTGTEIGFDYNGVAGDQESVTVAGQPAGTYYIGISSKGNVGYSALTGALNGGAGTTTGSYALTISSNATISGDDDNSSYSTATDLGTLAGAGQFLSSQIEPQSVEIPPLSPSSAEPGHRDIPVEGHGEGSSTTPTAPSAITVFEYNFADEYGSLFGQTLYNQITEGQKLLARQMFEIFSYHTGIQFKETANSGLHLVTGDVRAADPALPASVGGVSSGLLTIINASTYGTDDVWGGGWMGTALHEIGHTLGLGHAGDLQAVMDGMGDSTVGEVAVSEHDLAHLRRIYEPFSTDIDLYKFTVDETGFFTAEITAERLSETSMLDSELTLFRDPFATATSSFGTSGASEVQLQFESVAAGVVGNDIRIQVVKSAAEANASVTSVSGHTITLRVNDTNVTATQVVDAINTHTKAKLLVEASIVSGLGTQNVASVTGGTIIALSGGNREVISSNDNYYSNDSFIGIELTAGTYYLGVTASGNTNYDPTVSDTGYGGQSDGEYDLRLDFTPAPASSLTDDDNTEDDDQSLAATALDGDADGEAGGTFNFWFESGNTLYVDKTTTAAPASQDGSSSNPYDDIASALSRAASRIVVPTDALAEFADGDLFTIDDGTTSIIFEFDMAGDGVTDPNEPVDLSAAVTVDDVVDAITNAINGKFTGMATADLTADLVNLENVITLDVSKTPALLTAPNLVRIVGNGGTDRDPSTEHDATPYLIGVDNVGTTELEDGRTFNVPQGVTVMIDAGAVLKLQSANIDVGSSVAGIDRQDGALQVLGTPDARVFFTSFRNDAIGGDTDGASTGAKGGQWGGLVFRTDSDMNDDVAGDRDLDTHDAVFLNAVYQADLSYGGGQVEVDSVSEVYTPLHMDDERPTIAFNRITNSADAAISADPNSFDDSLDRIGPDVHGNTVIDNSINGLFIRIDTELDVTIDKLTRRARFNDTDITHVIAENLLIEGNPGGAIDINETQQLEVLGTPNGGYFTLTYPGATLGTSASLVSTTGSSTTLSSNITSSQTVLTVANASLLCAEVGDVDDFLVLVGDEQMLVTNITGNQLTVLRAQNGTASVAHSAADTMTRVSWVGTSTTLDEAIDDSVTSFHVVDGTLLGAVDGNASTVDFYILVGTEEMAVKNIAWDEAQGNYSLTVLRAQNGTAAADHGNGDIVTQISIKVQDASNLPAFDSFSSTRDYNIVVDSSGAGTAEAMAVRNVIGNTLIVDRDILNAGIQSHGEGIIPGTGSVSRSNLTIELPYNATAAEIQTALEALDGIREGGVEVTGGPLPQADVFVEYTNQMGSRDVGELVVDSTNLNPGALRVTTTTPGGVQTARLAGRLDIDPGVVVKLGGARIEAERGSAQLIAEGTEESPIIFTSVADDRYGGGGGTFDLGNDDFIPNPDGGTLDTTPSAGQPGKGDWAGMVFNLGTLGNFDHVLVSYAGGSAPIQGDTVNFNTIEVHEADLRVANSTFEFNDDGYTGNDRNGRGSNDGAVIFVRGAQPIIVNNVFQDNDGSVISIDANALEAINVSDPGRATGESDAYTDYADNQGPLVRLNRMDNITSGFSGTLGMEIRAAELTTESVWDDTDIVHVLASGTIYVDNAHSTHGLRLQSAADESLVVKLGSGAGFEIGNPDHATDTTTSGPSDIDDRIGGTMQIIGAPGFPVVLTSLKDDSVGASLDATGFPQTDTNGDGTSSSPAAGDWDEILFDKMANDRNVAMINESEAAVTGGVDVNGTITSTFNTAQFLGNLAPNNKSANEDRRAGFEVHGYIAADDPTDVDVYSFTAEAGTEIWLDIDQTNPALDTVLELVNSSGTVLARSQDNDTRTAYAVTPLSLTKTDTLGGDFYATTIRDAGMRLFTNGDAGTTDTYFVRVRSNPLQDNLTDLNGGLTSGQYQLQIRIGQQDETPGVAVQFADIRYATNGIHVKGLPYHSPLTGESGEDGTSDSTNDTASATTAIDLGNLLSSDRTTFSAGGELISATDIDFYRFRVDYTNIQEIAGLSDGGKTWATTIDLDWADGLTRPDTTIALFQQVGSQIQLVYIGRESNVLDDQPAAGQGTDLDDLSRGSAGKKDPFIGTVQLEEDAGGTNEWYYLAVVNNQMLPQALNAVFDTGSTENPVNTTVRLEPVNSVTRIAEDHIGFTGYTSNGAPIDPVSEDPLLDITSTSTLETHVVPFTLQDVVLYVTQEDQLYTINPLTGNTATRIDDNLDQTGNNSQPMQDIVMRSDGTLYGYQSLDDTEDTAGRLVTIGDDGTLTAVGTNGYDNIQGDDAPQVVTSHNSGDTNFDDLTITDEVGALTFERYLPSGSITPTYWGWYSVFENGYDVNGEDSKNSKLYRFDADSGQIDNGDRDGWPDDTGFGDIQYSDVRYAEGTLNVTASATSSSSIKIQARAPGEAGEGITIYVYRGNYTTAVDATNPSDGRINLYIDDDPSDPNADAIIDRLNTDDDSRFLITAARTNSTNATAVSVTSTVTLTGGVNSTQYDPDLNPYVRGNVTGLAFATTEPQESADLYAVTDAGELLRIPYDQLRGEEDSRMDAELVRDFQAADLGIEDFVGFQGLALGPQNLDAGLTTTLAAGIDNSQTTFQVEDASVFSRQLPFPIQIENEEMLVTHIDVDTNTLTVVRGFNDLVERGNHSTNRRAHDSGDAVTTTGRYRSTFFAIAFDHGGDDVIGNSNDNYYLVAFRPDGTEVLAFDSGNTTQLISTSTTPPDTMPTSGEFTLTFTDTTGQQRTTDPLQWNAPGQFSRDEVQEIDTVDAYSGSFTLSFLDTYTEFTSLVDAIDADAGTTTFNVDNADGFPAVPFNIMVDNELMKVTGVTLNVSGTDDEFTVTRGVNGVLETHEDDATVREVRTATVNNGGGIGASDTTFDVNLYDIDTVLPSAGGFLIRVNAEDMYVNSIADTTLTVTRGMNDTAPVAHNDLSTIYLIQTTTLGALSFDAAAADVQSELEALGFVGTGNVTATGGNLDIDPVLVQFTNDLGSFNLEGLVVDLSELNGNEQKIFSYGQEPDSGTFTMTFTVGGTQTTGAIDFDSELTGTDEVQLIDFTGTPGSGSFQLTFSDGVDSETTRPIAYNASAATIQLALEELSLLDQGDVQVTGNLPGGASVRFMSRFAGADMPQMTIVSDTTSSGAQVSTTTPGDPTGGNANSTVKGRLEALGNIRPGDIIVTGTGTAEEGFTVEFAGRREDQNFGNVLTLNAGNLGTSPATNETVVVDLDNATAGTFDFDLLRWDNNGIDDRGNSGRRAGHGDRQC